MDIGEGGDGDEFDIGVEDAMEGGSSKRGGFAGRGRGRGGMAGRDTKVSLTF